MLAVLIAIPLLQPAASVQPTGPAEEVVVYSARIESLIKPMFEAFTEKTGIQIKYFNAGERELFERLQSEGANTPADVFMTVDVGNLWIAEHAGLLQGFGSEVIDKNIPSHLRAKDNEWVGLSVRARPIMYSTERVKPGELSSYEALGDPKWQGKLCLRTSKKVYTQSLVAAMIKTIGEERTEGVVRRWMANQPRIFDSDSKLLEAMAAGQCDVGIANTYYLAHLAAKNPRFPVAAFWPNQADRGVHINISGAGVTKHAKHRDHAIQLIEFLSSSDAQNLYADANYEYPANPGVKASTIITAWGDFKADTVDVAAAGELQAAAVKLLDRVGYK
ncbi:MAG TPA: extracellular solute-binding protein [Candidatus Tectomicrobia bacterium]|nr:extracellular solute-binding protein [Candidatus Tectomicrobia bacterium]